MANKYYFNSGLYDESFYIKHKIDFYNDYEVCEKVEYDYDLLTSHYINYYEFEYTDDNDLREQFDQLFWERLGYWPTFFEPRVFNKKIALECGLTPFAYEGVDMLALSGCGMDLSPRLDAYQVLSHKTIDKGSEFFSATNQGYFENVVGNEIMKEMKNILKEILEVA